MEGTSIENKRACHDFAKKHSCVRESYFNKTFEGNECSKLLSKIYSSDDIFSGLIGLEHHIKAIKMFAVVKEKCFSN